MRLFLSFASLIFLFISAAFAQDGFDLSQIETKIAERERTLAEIEQRLSADYVPGRELLDLREELRNLRLESTADEVPLAAELNILNNDLQSLGPPPAEGEPPETDEIKAERKALQDRIAVVRAAKTKLDLNIAAASRLAERISLLRREAFTGRLLTRAPYLFDLEQWKGAVAALTTMVQNASTAVTGWVEEKREQDDLTDAVWALGTALAFLVILLVPVQRAIHRITMRRVEAIEPMPSRRVILAAVRTLTNVLPGIIGGFVVYEVFRLNGAIPPDGERLAQSIWLALVVLLFANGAVTSVFAPKLPRWRIAPLGTASVISVRAYALTAAFVLVFNRLLTIALDKFSNPADVAFFQYFTVSVILGALLFLISRDTYWVEDRHIYDRKPGKAADEGVPLRLVEAEAPPGAPERPTVAIKSFTPAEPAAPPSRMWMRIRMLGRIIGVVTILAAVTGFVALASYISSRSFLLIGTLGIAISVRALMREGVRGLDRRFGTHTNKEGDEEEDNDRLLYSWIGISIDFLTVALFIPFALVVLGASWGDVRGWVFDAFVGFEVGGVRISFAKIITAAAIFLGFLWVTRIVQRTADSQFFPRSRMDVGVQNSLRTLMGYIGLVIAVAAGIGTLGFDLQNLAIIAGALSVGIGFGLQSIVNNFVSGLILLFERPIKVGDWIVTTSGEGIVKRISVRSTEIETFDRSSVIVPNSELISSAVTNWTHKDKMGRIVIAVGASYDSDAAHVIRVLEDVAHKSRDILSFPAPFVVFEDFGGSSLDFTLRAYVRDIGQSLGIRTRLRVAIHERFKEEGIEIPFPQQDVHVRNFPKATADEPVTNGHAPRAKEGAEGRPLGPQGSMAQAIETDPDGDGPDTTY